MTDVILQRQLTSASVCFPPAFKTVTLVFHITQFFSVGYIGEVCLNVSYDMFLCFIFLLCVIIMFHICFNVSMHTIT